MIKVATDAGGTFTDLVAFDEESGALYLGKALTTPADPSRGVLAAIGRGRETGLAPERVSHFVHGGTTAINAITERKGVRTALVTTRGFRDVLAIGRGNRPDLYNLRAQPPEPFVPRRLRFEVEERVDARGAVRAPLSFDDLDRVAERLAAERVEAVAVAFLHAYANPAHEIAAAARLAERLPGVAIAASSGVSRQWREYERTNTAVLTAYVQPILARYLARLDAALREERFEAAYYCMQSNGGLATFAAAAAAPLSLVESGPAGGVAGAVRIGEALGQGDLLYLDVGGTTAKCSLVRDGRPALRPDYKLEWSRLRPGYPVQVPVVDIVEIGAGGGSLARIGADGGLAVGPDSAGAEPGPACYGRGGTEPTVTDAKLLTGAIGPEAFAGGRLRLDARLAARAFAPLADRLGLDVAEAARAVIRLAEANMMNALKLVTIQRGHDPRDLTLIASGGGGPLHAAALGRELQVKRVVIPRHAGLFSAWGMLAARPRVDLHRTRLAALTPKSFADIAGLFAELEAEARAMFPAGRLMLTRAIEMRYAGQEHAIATPFSPGGSLAELREAFHAAHERAYTFRLDDTGAELVTFHLAAELDAPRIALPEITGGDVAAARRGERLYEGAPAAVYDRDLLPAGARLAGPALIEEATTTTLVLDGQTVSVDKYGLLHIEET